MKIIPTTAHNLEAARFKPYTGAAGPKRARIHENNLALMHWAREHGHKCQLIETDFGGAMDEPVECVQFDGFTAGYDRWGFVFDGSGDFEGLDQADFAVACAAITSELGGKPIAEAIPEGCTPLMMPAPVVELMRECLAESKNTSVRASKPEDLVKWMLAALVTHRTDSDPRGIRADYNTAKALGQVDF